MCALCGRMVYTCKSKEAKMHLCPHFNAKSGTKDIETSIKERVIRTRYRVIPFVSQGSRRDF